MVWLLGLGCVSLGVVIGIVITTTLSVRNAQRWYQRLGAEQGCPVCRIREYEANSAEIIEMQEYRKRHGRKN